MNKINSLNEIVELDSEFKTAVNLYLSLNKKEKILKYIPTKSSTEFVKGYLQNVIDNKEQATLLIGPYGKGKSHLLLVLLAVLSLERSDENTQVIKKLADKFGQINNSDDNIVEKILFIWNNKGRFLPVIINDSTGELNQSFLYALNEALKREGLNGIIPDTYFSVAIKRLNDWEDRYPENYEMFINELEQYDKNIDEIKAELSRFSQDALRIFKEIYPTITAGSDFNPMVNSEVLPLYKNVSELLVEDYGYSGIYIVFDEFSKFIEGQDGSVVGNNMKLLQDICELTKESSNAQVFITMVAHKSIKEYGKYLSSEIINQFTGIEGRITEKLFVTSSKNNYELIKNAIHKDELKLQYIPMYERLLGQEALKLYYQLPAFRGNFQEDDFKEIVLRGCYPLNPIAAYLLLNVSEKVAQNERTLFTFISNDEPNSMARYIFEHNEEQDWIVGAALIYDYFSSLFKKDVKNELIHNIWLSAEYAISKCMNITQINIVKSLAVILIVNKEDEMPADEKYLLMATMSDDAAIALAELVKNQLIYKKGSTNSYAFKTRAGTTLKTEIKRRREIKGDNVNYARSLESITGKHFVVPRKYNSMHRMTRYFRYEFMNVDDFLSIKSAESFGITDNKLDGKVISLYGFVGIKQDLVKKHILNLSCKQLVVLCPKKGIKIAKKIKDYEIVQELRRDQAFYDDNAITKRELPLLEEDLIKEIQEALNEIYDDDKECRTFYFNGEEVVRCKKGVEQAVNECSENVFYKTPEINNEIINRQTISTAQTRKARISIIEAILNHSDDEKFYAGTNQEATVYRSVFCNTGLVDDSETGAIREIIDNINAFVDSCSDKKITLKMLIDDLQGAPYGMRAGVIPLYVAYVLSRRREDIIIYFSNMEVQLTADIVVNMCENSDDYELFVSKEDVQKEKYISSLNELFMVRDNKNLSDNRIKNILICMQRWFRSLPQISRNLSDIVLYESSDIARKQILTLKKYMQKVEVNPYEILFVSFPAEFGIDNDLESVFEIIDKCKTAFDDYFDWMQQQTILSVYEIFDSRKKQDLFHTIREWYDKQSDLSKQGLHSGRVTNLMSCIEKMNVYNDAEVIKKLVKAVSDVYMENWTTNSYSEYLDALANLKKEIEKIHEEKTDGKMKLAFIGRNGQKIEKYYERVDESTGSILRNILEDTLEENEDLSINDRVGILLEMIEKLIG